MTEPKWTAGPWSVGEMTMDKKHWAQLWYKEIPIIRRGQDVIAVVWGVNDTQEKANVGFIAAAPEMYEAAMKALSVLHPETEEYKALDAAMAKARGET
jgi:hypothetical protein